MSYTLSGQCLRDIPQNWQRLAKAPTKTLWVTGPGVHEQRKFTKIELEGGRKVWCGVKTGTLYDVETGQCLSSSFLRVGT